MPSEYYNQTQRIVVAILFHYVGYLVILVLDSVDYIKKIRIVYGGKIHYINK